MKGHIFRISTVMACLAGFALLQGCAQNDSLSEIGLLPAGHSVVFAAPAGKNTAVRSAVPEPVVFRFRRVDKEVDQPTYLDLIGSVDQSVRIFAAKPGTYRLVEAYLRSRPGESRWSFKEAPNILEVKEGEAAYVGTLHWRDTWVEIVNNEAEARAIYQKRLTEFKSRSLNFVTRLVAATRHSR